MTSASMFLVSVKQCLSQESYKLFMAALTDYKKNDDLQTLIPQLFSLFCQDPGKHILMRGFYQFIRPHHKKEFDLACKEFTGNGCGYKAEHSVPRTEREREQAIAGSKLTFSESSAEHLNHGGGHLSSESLKAPASNYMIGPNNKDHQTQVAAYLKQVKEALGSSNFQRFSVALSSYKKTDNYDAMVCEIAALLTEKPEHCTLMREFHRFVRIHHKKMFNQLCVDLTGESICPRKAECQSNNGKPSIPSVQDIGVSCDDNKHDGTKSPEFHKGETSKNQTQIAESRVEPLRLRTEYQLPCFTPESEKQTMPHL